MEIASLYKIYLEHPFVTTDTRSIKKGDIFFALKGPKFDANTFAQQALNAGAAFVVVDNANYVLNHKCLLCQDVLTTLQQLAQHHRKQLAIPVIAITGSNGKTTTKELAHAVLSTTYKTATTVGNLNNHIGIPLTILRIPLNAEIAIIEMGANHLHEIESYCGYTLPTLGLITNCGKAHLEGFGSEAGVRKGKGELFDYLRQNNGTAFVCNDFEYFQQMVIGIHKINWYGTKLGKTKGQVLQSNPYLEIGLEADGVEVKIATQLVGDYNLYNVLAAVAIAQYFNIPLVKIKAAIEQYFPENSRSQMVLKNGNHIIMDAYNANPSSMLVAIENFAALKMTNKIIFLGAMMELGNQSKQEHLNLIHLLKKHKWKNVILVGGDFKNVEHPFIYFETSDQAAKWWELAKTENNYLLIKGSRSTAMEKILASS